MSDFIKTLLDEAHVDYLNGAYEESVRKLKSIKLRIKEKNKFDNLVNKEIKYDNEYMKEEIKSRNESTDEIEYINR